MAVQYAPQKLTVPEGFNNLLEGLAREVLRDQPENIIKFAAEYFKKQIATRVADGEEPPRPQPQQVSEEKEEAAPTPPPPSDPTPPPPSDPTPPPQPTAEDIATEEVQSTDVDEDAKEQDSPRLTEEEAATKIQAMIRGKKARDDVETMKAGKEQTEKTPTVTENETPTATENENESANEQSNTETEEEQQQSDDAPANDSQTEETKEVEVEEATEEELTGAALKIQATFRGAKARKQVAAQKESINNIKSGEEGETPGETKEEMASDEAKPAPTEEAN